MSLSTGAFSSPSASGSSPSPFHLAQLRLKPVSLPTNKFSTPPPKLGPLPPELVDLVLESYMEEYRVDRSKGGSKMPFHQWMDQDDADAGDWATASQQLHESVKQQVRILPLLTTSKAIYSHLLPILYRHVHLCSEDNYITFLSRPSISSYSHIQTVDYPLFEAVDIVQPSFHSHSPTHYHPRDYNYRPGGWNDCLSEDLKENRGWRESIREELVLEGELGIWLTREDDLDMVTFVPNTAVPKKPSPFDSERRMWTPDGFSRNTFFGTISLAYRRIIPLSANKVIPATPKDGIAEPDTCKIEVPKSDHHQRVIYRISLPKYWIPLLPALAAHPDTAVIPYRSLPLLVEFLEAFERHSPGSEVILELKDFPHAFCDKVGKEDKPWKRFTEKVGFRKCEGSCTCQKEIIDEANRVLESRPGSGAVPA